MTHFLFSLELREYLSKALNQLELKTASIRILCTEARSCHSNELFLSFFVGIRRSFCCIYFSPYFALLLRG
jgi:hypothetical protein